MHRTVGTVFKVLGISIVLMIVLDLVFVVVDTLTVNNRIESMAIVIQDELSRNNCIPDSIAPLFIEQIKSIKTKSKVMNQEANGLITNIDRDVTVDGVTYKALSEANVKEYGEELQLVIVATMEPKSVMFVRDAGNNEGSFLTKRVFSYQTEYEYTVPALRNLK